MRTIRLLLPLAALILAGYLHAADNMPPGVQTQKTASGMMVLADAKGMTLYTFDKDTTGMSMCKEQCAVAWPPLKTSADAMSMGDWTIVNRDDGSKQWAYKGKPLYTYSKDTKAGDTTGDGVGKIWHMAMP